MPAMSVRNGLCLTALDDPDLKLTEIENNLIAQNIVLQKIFLLPKSRMSAVKDRLVNVPVGPADIINTMKNIPRTPNEAGLIQVKLKRKLEFRNFHKHEYIDPQKIFKTLEILKKKGHPYYQFYDDYSTFKCRWRTEGLKQNSKNGKCHKKIEVKFIDDPQTQAMVDLKQRKKNVEVTFTFETKNINNDKNEDDEEEYLRKDPVRKFQFDHNVSTCLTNKFPEMILNDDGEEFPEDH